MFCLDPKKILWNQELGKGSYGKILPYKSKSDDEDQWVVKHIIAINSKKFISCMNEIILGFSCNHPSILPIKGYFLEEVDSKPKRWEIYLKLPRMIGDLRAVIKEYQRTNTLIPETDIIKTFYALVLGIEYLHEKKITHRDIKPDNILINENGELKIADIGAGMFIAEDDTSVHLRGEEVFGTRGYLPPEVINQKQTLKKRDLYWIDVWGLGIVVLEMCFGRVKEEEFSKIGLEKIFDSLKSKYSFNLLELLRRILVIEPSQRILPNQIRQELERQFPHLLSDLNNLKLCPETMNIFQQKKMSDQKEKIQEIPQISKPPSEIKIQSSRASTPFKSNEEQKNQQEKDFEFDEPMFQEMRQELQEKWKDMFEFNLTNGFEISTKKEEIQDQDIIKLTAELQSYGEKSNKLKRLESLSLNLQKYCRISDEGAEVLAVGIGENMNNLTHLTLNFSNCDQITGNSLRVLGAQLNQKLRKLEELKLNLRNCNGIDDQGLTAFGNQVNDKFKKLRHLELDLSANKNITAEGIKSLFSQFKNNLTNLHCLSLKLEHCNFVKDENIKTLILNLDGSTPKLQSISLGFSLK